MPLPELPKLSLARAWESLRSGDVLLFRAHGWVAALIRWGTRSDYSHAALAWWTLLDDSVPAEESPKVLLVLESREVRGCRAIQLEAALEAGRIFHYRPTVPLDRVRTIRAALERLGASYGYRHVVLDAIGRLPLLSVLGSIGLLAKIPYVGRLFARIPWGKAYSTDDLEDPGRKVKCSTYVSLAYRAGGVDLVRELADRSTDPGDLARSTSLEAISEIVKELP